jgi:hypothetical protein
MAAPKLLRAKASFACEVDGNELLVHAGEVVASSHPAVKGRAELFEPAEPQPDLEKPARPRRRAKAK